MAEWVQVVPLLATTGVMGWAGNASLQWLKARGERQQAREGNEVDLEQHRDKIMFEMLSALRGELTAARLELAELRPLQTRFAQLDARLAHFDEALGHLQTLLEAKDPSERAQAERLARAFVNRMRRLDTAHGTILNEMQRDASANRLADGAGDLLGKLPD